MPIRTVLNDSLTDLIAALQIYSSRWWSITAATISATAAATAAGALCRSGRRSHGHRDDSRLLLLLLRNRGEWGPGTDDGLWNGAHRLGGRQRKIRQRTGAGDRRVMLMLVLQLLLLLAGPHRRRGGADAGRWTAAGRRWQTERDWRSLNVIVGVYVGRGR